MMAFVTRKFALVFVVFCAGLFTAFGVLYISAPPFKQVVEMATGSDQVLLDKNGQVLQTLRTDFKKRRLAWQPLSSFPDHVQKTIIFSEDHRFHEHWGVDPVGLARAVWTNVQGKRVQGASTIPMQVSDLIQPQVLDGTASIRKGSVVQKLKQIFRGLALSIRWSKAELLEAYLNLVHLRGEFQGISALSYAYLNRDPLALEPAHSIVIATMISAPNQNEKTLQTRSCLLLNRILQQSGKDLGLECSAVAAAASQFFIGSPKLPTSFGLAPHLARRLFQEHPGQSLLRSHIDSNLQKTVQAILEKNIARLSGSNVKDTSAIVIENSTGKVLAYVGAVATSESPHVDGVTSYRQAGSSLKPFVYAKGIDKKLLTATSIFLDEPTAISWGRDVYRPSNYDRHFFGPVTLRESLGSSLNVPAVKAVLVIGLHETYKLYQDLKLSRLKPPDFYGVSMALGAVEVRLDELANAYRMLSNQGRWSELQFVVDQKQQTPDAQIFTPETSFIVADILADPNARAIGFGWDSPLETPFFSAVKTGTSKDYRDNWCSGFSSKYTVAVWAGNFDAQAMRQVSGVSGAGPSWFEIMSVLHAQEKSANPAVPEKVMAKQVQLGWSSQERTEYYIAGTEPTEKVIQLARDKRAEFIFPAQGSVLVKDPHQDSKQIALFIRFSGQVPSESRLILNGKELGQAVSPFKMENPPSGSHQLSIRSPEGKELTQVRFTVKGPSAKVK